MSAREDNEDQCGGAIGRRYCDQQITLLVERVHQARAEIAEIKDTLDRYVTQHEFSPVKLLAYGMAGLILTAVISALVASVIVK